MDVQVTDRRALLLRGLVVLGVALCLLAPIPEAVLAKRPPLLILLSGKTRATSISVVQLKRCFLGKEVTLGGDTLLPLNHPAGSETRERFDESVLAMDSIASQRYWIDSMIRGGRKAPRSVPNTALLMRVLAHMQGAIGYLEGIPSQVGPGVTVLTIDGEAPGSAGYPLK